MKYGNMLGKAAKQLKVFEEYIPKCFWEYEAFIAKTKQSSYVLTYALCMFLQFKYLE